MSYVHAQCSSLLASAAGQLHGSMSSRRPTCICRSTSCNPSRCKASSTGASTSTKISAGCPLQALMLPHVAPARHTLWASQLRFHVHRQQQHILHLRGPSCRCRASSAADGSSPKPEDTSSSSNSSSNKEDSSGGSVGSEAWSLMGRVVSSDRLVLGQGSRSRLVLLAAAKQAGISPDEMTERLQELVTLLPDLSSLLPSLNPSTLAALARDTAGVAQKLIGLRLLFPAADVSQMISRRPTLLLDEEYEQVEEARSKLLARLAPKPPAIAADPAAAAAAGGGATQQPNMLGTTTNTPSGSSGSSSGSAAAGAAGAAGGGGPGSSSPVLDGLVSRQPLLLVRNVDTLLDELERLLPVDVMAALLLDPDLVTQVMCNRNLSLWLMPGTAVLSLLQSNPDMLYMVQRGTQWLGPGAEFMGPG